MRERGAGFVLVRLAVAAALGLAVAVALASCRSSAEEVADGADPLAALAAPAQSARYDGPFWTREAHRNSRTWQAARAFCAKSRDRGLPNCHAVELVRRWEEGLPPAALPELRPPPPAPPAMHPGEAGYVEADVAALKAWEARLLIRGRAAAGQGRR
ncbi:MAG TPA: hypothetical protein VHG32_07335 [Thermoanaerobaculia bacterium]|jgi:hypothetical protein|nr:hypothetical protein [Thermoanaerobaculia bacterium]